MRLSLIPLISLLPLALSSPSPTEGGSAVERGWDHQPKCNDLPTRDPDTCECLPGFYEPGYYKRTEDYEAESKGKGGHHYKECVCPDYPNTYIDFGNGGHGGGGGGGYGGYKRKGGYEPEPECKCKGKHQHYDPDTEKCECDEGYEPVDDWYYDKRGGKGGHHPKPLKCKPCPTPSGGYGHGGKKNYKRNPSLHEAIKMREQDERALETVLGCKDEEEACESNGSWRCTDVSSSLWSCGGCPGQGVDCGAVPGVSEVRCHQGRCLIDTCRRGYTVTPTPSPEYGTNTSCVSNNGSRGVESSKSHWFVNQAE
ncbi:hypothetical protein I317_01150 [Kwoniella heveanensis CBS 569]|uniref:Protein CPL1-like domain-containing protein n=1 Tax=Kwoniella heveanensis BCC8398 TaxID=1296120 RepID=A0A1B9GK12_9TREE|nr:hypothetical protein I316_06999 [Kwoniella heveanensis BCC8398]OCF44871.1 hypothetical protein I317_01150 [Kwoniella heveanensis CBS 569]